MVAVRCILEVKDEPCVAIGEDRLVEENKVGAGAGIRIYRVSARSRVRQLAWDLNLALQSPVGQSLS